MQLHRQVLDRRTGKLVGAAFLSLLVASTSARATSDTLIPCSVTPATLSLQSTQQAPAGPLIPPDLVIHSVLIDPDNIFDLENPEENRLLYRLANKLHRVTRQNVIQQQLLFAEGDEYEPRVLKESERLLRHNRYIQNANVETVVTDDCDIDVKVHTTDTWTFSPKLSLSRAGGHNKSSFGVKEMNLLGTGIAVEAVYSSNVDRSRKILRVRDNNLGDSWYQLDFYVADNSDGQTLSLDLGKPFYSLDSTESYGVSFFDDERIDSLYDLGEVTGEYGHRTRSYDIHRGWSKGLVNGSVRRFSAGLAYDDHQFFAPESALLPAAQLPPDRTIVYPYIGFEWTQDRYEKVRNRDQIGRVEDSYLGSRFSARLGYAPEQFGSTRNAWILSAQGQKAFGDSQDNSLIIGGHTQTRIESGRLQDLLVGASLKYYDRQSEKRLFFAELKGTYGHSLDPDHLLYLGGDNGLRGYPLRYQAGDKQALLTVEERFFTNWYPFRLFHVGAAAFFDVGRTWGDSFAPSTNAGWLKDAGFGLRIGSDRSGLGNMIHVDVAFPLDGTDSISDVQFLVSTKRGF